ncbi:hypothetical protein [Nocardia sp. NPDC052566]|uniref:hypothetical protein n=1 Tax=Nocardia sp. NPDC052566 TaxID=3364330 RepID=UPI0037C857D9
MAHEIAIWTCVACVIVLAVSVVGMGLGRVFTLVDTVYMLESWIGEVRIELLAQEQADEFQAMRQRISEVNNRLDAFAEAMGQAEPDDDGEPGDDEAGGEPWPFIDLAEVYPPSGDGWRAS